MAQSLLALLLPTLLLGCPDDPGPADDDDAANDDDSASSDVQVHGRGRRRLVGAVLRLPVLGGGSPGDRPLISLDIGHSWLIAPTEYGG